MAIDRFQADVGVAPGVIRQSGPPAHLRFVEQVHVVPEDEEQATDQKQQEATFATEQNLHGAAGPSRRLRYCVSLLRV